LTRGFKDTGSEILTTKPELVKLIADLDDYNNDLSDLIAELTGPQAAALANEQFLTDVQKLAKSAKDFTARVKNLKSGLKKYMGSDRVKALTKAIAKSVEEIEQNGPFRIRGNKGTVVDNSNKTNIHYESKGQISVVSNISGQAAVIQTQQSPAAASALTSNRPTI